MRHVHMTKDLERGNCYTYGMPTMDDFMKLRSGYDASKELQDIENRATVIFFKLFMPCCGTHANYADKHNRELLSNIYSPSQEGYVLIELKNNYEKWILKAKELYEKNDKKEISKDIINDDQDTEDDSEKTDKTAVGTLYTNSRFHVSMDGWSEEGIKIYNNLCRVAEKDRNSEKGIVFEKQYRDEERKKRENKEDRTSNEEEFIEPYNNLMDDSDDESDDDDDNTDGNGDDEEVDKDANGDGDDEEVDEDDDEANTDDIIYDKVFGKDNDYENVSAVPI